MSKPTRSHEESSESANQTYSEAKQEGIHVKEDESESLRGDEEGKSDISDVDGLMARLAEAELAAESAKDDLTTAITIVVATLNKGKILAKVSGLDNV